MDTEKLSGGSASVPNDMSSRCSDATFARFDLKLSVIWDHKLGFNKRLALNLLVGIWALNECSQNLFDTHIGNFTELLASKNE